MARSPRSRRTRSLRIDWPALSDQNVVELLSGIQQILAQFESQYFAQIRRFYDDRSERNLRQHHLSADDSGEPF